MNPLATFTTFLRNMVRHQRHWFGQWHAWAGVLAGLVLVVVSLTGTLLVFEQELDVWWYPELFTFAESGERLGFGETLRRVQQAHPDWEIKGVYHMPQRNHAYVLNYGADYRQAIVNPYTGAVTGTRVYQESVMGFIRHLHRTLLIPTVGKYVVGIASLVLVVLMITGLRLWLPQRWSHLRARLGVKRGASRKRQTYDWHNTLGFYLSPVITLVALTGAAITFSPLVILTLFLVSFEPPQSVESILGQTSEYQAGQPTLPVHEIVKKANRAIPGGIVEGVTLPTDSVGTFGMNIIAPGAARTGDVSLVYYDQYSGERVMSTHHDLAHMGKAYLNWVTPIHYGTFGGLTTRLLAMLASLVVPVLFVTGFLIWRGRWKKRRPRGVEAASSVHAQPQPQ